MSSSRTEVAGPGRDETRRILVATDGSAWSAEAVTFAVELAAVHQAELVFVHVVPTIDLVRATDVDDLVGPVPHEPTEYDRVVLEDAAAVAAAHRVPATTALLGGSTAEEIVACGDSCHADVIVVGSRGHSAVASALLGSVSLGVLAHATRPVLVVHGMVDLGHHVRR